MKTLIIIATFIFLALNNLSDAPPSKHPATILLICDEGHLLAWRKFADWKTSIGKATRIISVQKISRKYKGKDLQEKIRLCCIDHINNHNTKWVILGGDSEPDGKGLVPDRDTFHNNMYVRYDNIPTDVYYLSEKNWDANNDGIYGDWENDKDAIEYINTKASIGRIPIRTKKDIIAYTEKVIAYESHYPENGFAENLVYTCPMAGAYPKLHTSKKVLENTWTSGAPVQFFANATPWDKSSDGDHDLVPDNWVKLINGKTFGKMHIHGHGLLSVWVLENNETIDSSHINKLANENAYLAMTTVSCLTGKYDGRADPSITESMLRKAKGGAVIIVAPSREGVPIFHNPRTDFALMAKGKMDGTTATLTNFWRHALSENLTAGEAMSAAKADMIQDAQKSANFHYIQCELNLLGDPTLDLRAKNPRTAKLTVPQVIKRGEQRITIKTDAPGATVCLSKDDDLYHTEKTDSNGNLNITINPLSDGQILVRVSGPSLNVASTAIQVN